MASATTRANTRYDQTDTNIIKTGAWPDFANTAAYLGSYGRSSTADAKATIYFTGTKIAWIGMKGSTPGIVDVYLDDVKKATLDLYASPAKYQVTLWTSATLANGTHHMDLVRNSGSLSTEFIVAGRGRHLGTIYRGTLSFHPLRPDRHPHREDRRLGRLHATAAYLGSYGRSSARGPRPPSTSPAPDRLDRHEGHHHRHRRRLPGRRQEGHASICTASPAKYQVTLWTSATLANGTHHM